MATLYRIQVLVSHDDPVWRAGAIATLGRHEEFDVREGDTTSNAWGTGPAADVVVTDYHQGTGLAAAAAGLAGRGRGPRVLVVTMSERECEIRAALACGVQGYLLVGCAPDELACAVRAVQRGERMLSPQVATRLADHLAFDPLTSREEDVLCLLIEGLCNKSIADRLSIEVGTVKSHLLSMFGKLKVNNRTQAVALAEHRGLIPVRPLGREFLQEAHPQSHTYAVGKTALIGRSSNSRH